MEVHLQAMCRQQHFSLATQTCGTELDTFGELTPALLHYRQQINHHSPFRVIDQLLKNVLLPYLTNIPYSVCRQMAVSYVCEWPHQKKIIPHSLSKLQATMSRIILLVLCDACNYIYVIISQVILCQYLSFETKSSSEAIMKHYHVTGP